VLSPYVERAAKTVFKTQTEAMYGEGGITAPGGKNRKMATDQAFLPPSKFAFLPHEE